MDWIIFIWGVLASLGFVLLMIISATELPDIARAKCIAKWAMLSWVWPIVAICYIIWILFIAKNTTNK